MYATGVVAVIYLFEITLTLPGIAGIILGIGMAVDANVVINAWDDNSCSSSDKEPIRICDAKISAS